MSGPEQWVQFYRWKHEKESEKVARKEEREREKEKNM
jgi:hypothetical protein